MPSRISAMLLPSAAFNALVEVARDIFGRRYVSETWTSAGVGPSEWWTTAPGVPFSTIFFQALTGDAKRVDVAFGLVLEGELIRRAAADGAEVVARVRRARHCGHGAQHQGGDGHGRQQPAHHYCDRRARRPR